MEQNSAYVTEGKPTYTTAGTPREIEVLKLLARYDLLPSRFVYHATGNYYATRTMLTNLRKGHYIGLLDFPTERDPVTGKTRSPEKLAYIPRNGHYVYELKPRGRMLLAKHGDIAIQGGNDHFKHRLLRSEIEYLLDRAPFQVKGPEHILSDRRCPQSTRTAPYPFRIGHPKLEPDITRGFEDDGQSIFLHIEVDRGTEPVFSMNARQSLKSKVDRYALYLEQEAYKSHFGFTARPSVLFITTRPDTASLIDLFPDKWSKRFYATTITHKPLPTTDLFVPWQGRNGTLDLTSILERKKDGQSREGAEGHAALA